MPLFPPLAPEYADEKDKGILNRMQAFYNESIAINQSFWGEADTDTRFYNNDQTLWNDIYAGLPVNRRRQFCFNRIRRVVSMISGHQRRNRKSTTVIPVENGDALTADQFSKILMWVNRQEGVLETVSEAFEGALVTGMNLLQVWVDYRSDPISGNIKVDNCSYNSFLMDPFFRKTDLSDCNSIWKRSFLTKRECISLVPDQAELIGSLSGIDSRDGKFAFMPENYNFSLKNLLTYDEFYYRTFRKQKMLIDTQTGETMEWRGQNKESLDDFLRLYPQVIMSETEIPTVNIAVVVQGKVVYDGANPMGIDQYPFVPVFAYYSPQSPYFPYRIQGVVRGLRDAQYLYNRRKAIELDIFESQINSGWKYKENALVNPKDVFMSGQGRGLALKEDAQMTDVEQIMAPQIPPSMMQLSDSLGREIQEISGVNEELLGSATDDKAGILSMLRQGSGLITLQGLFDQLDRSQKLLGKLMIDVIQANFTSGKVKRIIEQEPTTQFYNKAFGRYDAAIEEGMNTTTQRQMQFAQFMSLKEAGVAIPDSVLLDAVTVQDKQKLIDAVEQVNQNRAQMEQQKAQADIALLQAQVELAKARATADTGLGLERVSRIQENKTMAAKNEDEALLNLIKAIKEIDGMDLNHMDQLIRMSHAIKDREEALDAAKGAGNDIAGTTNDIRA